MGNTFQSPNQKEAVAASREGSKNESAIVVAKICTTLLYGAVLYGTVPHRAHLFQSLLLSCVDHVLRDYVGLVEALFRKSVVVLNRAVLRHVQRVVGLIDAIIIITISFRGACVLVYTWLTIPKTANKQKKHATRRGMVLLV